MQRNRKSDSSRASGRSNSGNRGKAQSAKSSSPKKDYSPAAKSVGKSGESSSGSSAPKRDFKSAPKPFGKSTESSTKKDFKSAPKSASLKDRPAAAGKESTENTSKRKNVKPNYAAFKDQPKYFVKRKPKAPKVVHDDNSISVNKYVSNSGFCSRREADVYIEEGRVTINDEIATKGNRVYEDDVVAVDGEVLTRPTKTIILAMNKPLGITSTTDMNDPDNIIKFIGYPQRIFPIGRLDKDSEGLILLTNNGDIVNKILRAGNDHEKEYIVHVNKPIQYDFIQGMKNGVPMLGTTTLPCTVFQEGKNVFRIILVQGLNRQIRRMCEYFGYNVVRLKRTRIMNVSLGNLNLGSYRILNRTELDELNEMIEN